jgi:signal transduction histidine kinase
MTGEGIGRLRRFLQTLAFCLAISAIQWSFDPAHSYETPLVYSLAVGTFTWAWIDFGRSLFPSSAATGWPAPVPAVALVASGAVAGYLLGTLVGDRWLHRSSWNGWGQLRGSLLIAGLSTVAVTYYFYTRGRSRHLSREMQEAHRHATEARLKLLESQLEPHMLFNTLANLRVLIGLDPPRAQEMLDRLIAFLRATLDGSRESSQSLQQEFARIDDYLELMKVRMGSRLQTSLTLPAELADEPVPPLLLQPLVENAIKHGLEPKVNGGRLTVCAERDAQSLVLRVRDTGVGLRGAPDDRSFGLQQVRERLAALHGERASLQLAPADDGHGGTVATVRLPLQRLSP